MRKQNLDDLWREDGDMERMSRFFHRAAMNDEQKERIRRLTMLKLDSLKEQERLGLSSNDEIRLQDSPGKLSTFINSLWWRWRWKLAFPILALFLFVGILSTIPLDQVGFLSGNSKEIAQSSVDKSGSIAGSTANTTAPSISADSAYQSDQRTMTEELATTKAADSLSAGDGTTDNSLAENQRKVIQNLQAIIQVENIPTTVNSVIEKTKELGGYVVVADQKKDDSASSGRLIVKIPFDKLSSFQNSISAWGAVLEQHLSGTDITNEYFDAQTRLAHWQAEEERYLAILEKANTVDEMLKVENALASVREQIEQLKGQLKLWDNLTDYSTVTLDLRTQKATTVSVNYPWQPLNFWKTLLTARDALLKTISTLWNFINYILIGLGYMLPIILIAGAGYAVYYYQKKRRSKPKS